jgi:uncharacterized membrane protein YozB (DUF420 family)
MALVAGIISLVFGGLTLAFMLAGSDNLFGYLFIGNLRGSIFGLVITLLIIVVIVSTLVTVLLGRRLVKEGKRREGTTAMLIAFIGFFLTLAAIGVHNISQLIHPSIHPYYPYQIQQYTLYNQ